MFKENDIVNFACTKCGGCCKKTPNMSLIDMLELSNEFIFQTAHNVAVSTTQNPLEKRQLEYYQMIAHSIMMPELEATMFYFVDFSVTPLQSSTNCEKLGENGECNIYLNRPNACKIFPLSNKFDDSLQWKSVNFFKNMVDKGEWKCDFSSSASVLLKDNEIYNPAYRSIYNIEMENIRDFTDKYMAFLELFGEEKKKNHLKGLFSCFQKKQQLQSSIIVSLHCAIFYSMITEEQAEEFLKNQIVLLKKQSQYCIDSKIKENVQISRLYKKLYSDYESFLEKEGFRNDFTEQFAL